MALVGLAKLLSVALSNAVQLPLFQINFSIKFYCHSLLSHFFFMLYDDDVRRKFLLFINLRSGKLNGMQIGIGLLSSARERGWEMNMLEKKVSIQHSIYFFSRLHSLTLSSRVHSHLMSFILLEFPLTLYPMRRADNRSFCTVITFGVIVLMDQFSQQRNSLLTFHISLSPELICINSVCWTLTEHIRIFFSSLYFS